MQSSNGEVIEIASVVSGTFAIYAKPDGGAHLSLRLPDESEHHFDAPKFLVKMMMKDMAQFLPENVRGAFGGMDQ